MKQQKTTLANLNKSLNAAVQERDIAVSNADELFKGINQAKKSYIANCTA